MELKKGDATRGRKPRVHPYEQTYHLVMESTNATESVELIFDKNMTEVVGMQSTITLRRDTPPTSSSTLTTPPPALPPAPPACQPAPPPPQPLPTHNSDPAVPDRMSVAYILN